MPSSLLAGAGAGASQLGPALLSFAGAGQLGLTFSSPSDSSSELKTYTTLLTSLRHGLDAGASTC